MGHGEKKCYQSSESSSSSSCYEKSDRKKLCPCDTYIPEQDCLATQKPYKRIYKNALKWNKSYLIELVKTLVQNPTSANYAALANYLSQALTSIQCKLGNQASLLVADPSGQVIWSSSAGDRNTLANYQNGSLGNVASLPEVIVAQVSLSGVGVASRWNASAVPPAQFSYVATRIGLKEKYYTQNYGTFWICAPSKSCCH